MNLSEVARRRYTTKAYDPAGRVPQETIDDLLEMLRFAPSSVNSQPWHYVVAGSEAGRERIAAVMEGPYAYNAPKVRHASHVIVCCVRLDMHEPHLQRLLEQEQADGRFGKPEARQAQDRLRRGCVELHQVQVGDSQQWMEKQVYLALGTLLLGAALHGIDATPMEGLDTHRIDQALGLPEQGYTALVLVALGRRAPDEFNSKLPKSRLPREAVFSFI